MLVVSFLPSMPHSSKLELGEKEELYNLIQGKANLLVEEDEETILQTSCKNLAWNNKKVKHKLSPVTRKTGIKPLLSIRGAYSTCPHKSSG